MENTLVKKEDKNIKGFSTFVLKIIGILSMTLDHIGYVLQNVYPVDSLDILAYIFRNIGRLAMPIFIFCLLEGLTHTKNIKKYLFRLGIEALLIYLAITLIQIVMKESFNFGYAGNIFLTLFILALFYYFIYHSKYKFLAFIPILYIVLSLCTKLLFVEGFYTIREIKSFIYFNGLFLQYDVFATVLFIAALLGYKIYDYKINKKLGKENKEIIDTFKTSKEYQRSKNTIICVIIAFLSLLCYLITYLPFYNNGIDQLVDGALQSSMFFSVIFLFFYNGRKGYSNKAIQYAFYLYYPLHIILIYLVFYFIYK
jgi:hypothetical protein